MNRLSDILKYKMTEDEAKVFKICLMWEFYTKKLIPCQKSVKLPVKGDPRKSYLFKNCWKLLRETKGQLKDEEYKFYIQAQIAILKGIKAEDVHSLIEPGCLHGESAWKRWKVWQHKQNEKKFDYSVDVEYVKSEILRSKIRSYKEEDIIEDVKKGKISPYYLVIDPKIGDLSDKLHLDLKIYRERITKEILEWFRNLS